MHTGFSIHLSVLDGDPTGLRLIQYDKWNGFGDKWDGFAFTVQRNRWHDYQDYTGFHQPGIYLLNGYETDEIGIDREVIHIAETTDLLSNIRHDDQDADKAFWTNLTAFIINSDDNDQRKWLVWALSKKIKRTALARLFYPIIKREPTLTDDAKQVAEKSLQRILKILPLIGLNICEKRRKPASNNFECTSTQSTNETQINKPDTIIVPMTQTLFKAIFLDENHWHSIRIPESMHENLKWIAAYITHPITAITHIAEIASLHPYGASDYYKVVFKRSAEPLPHPIPFGIAPSGFFQGSRFVQYEQLFTAETINDLQKKP